jgi:hypothetical protein
MNPGLCENNQANNYLRCDRQTRCFSIVKFEDIFELISILDVVALQIFIKENWHVS